MKFIRHGDVYLIQVGALPKRAKKVPFNPILAEGEITGHKHELLEAEGVEQYEINGRMFLVFSEAGVRLSHPEHGMGSIPTGVYEKRIDQEYDLSADAVRTVSD